MAGQCIDKPCNYTWVCEIVVVLQCVVCVVVVSLCPALSKLLERLHLLLIIFL